MKKRKLLCLFLCAASIAAFLGYQALDRIRTDRKPPVISVGTETASISIHDPESSLLEGVTAKDNRDGDVTDSLVVEKVRLAGSDGTIKASLAAFDKAGNVAKTERVLQYSDYRQPTFSLSAPLNFIQGTSFEVLDVVCAEDILDGNISHRVRATSLEANSFGVLGTHEVRFSVTNSLGDTVELVMPVEICSPGQYNAKVELTDYLIYLPRGSAFNAKDYLKSFINGTMVTSLAGTIPESLNVQISGTVNTQQEGVYAVSYTIASSYYTGYSRLIVVVEG